MEPIGRRKSLVDETYETLLDAICTGQLGPGDRVTQDELAEQLNVSRQPVNSALAMLKAQQFVQDTGRRGVIVSPLDPDRFRNIFEVRTVLEPLAAELASRRVPRSELCDGRTLVDHGRRLIKAGDSRGLIQADIEFHGLIYGWSGNRVIAEFMDLNWQHMRRGMGHVLSNPDRVVRVWDEHHAILDAIEARDPAAAADRMRRHIVRASDEVMAELPD